jgi:predicted transposase YdaD
MPYITSIEEMGRKEGRQEGRQEGLREGAIIALQKAVLDALEVPRLTD